MRPTFSFVTLTCGGFLQAITASSLALLSDGLVETINKDNTVRACGGLRLEPLINLRSKLVQCSILTASLCLAAQGKWMMSEPSLSHVVFFSDKLVCLVSF
jgi:hypothetical protein